MKKIIPFILTFILIACSAPQAVALTVTATILSSPTASQPTSTILPSLTPTITPIPEKEYTSCMDAELMKQLDADFSSSSIGKSIEEYVNDLLKTGKMTESTHSVDPGHIIIADMVYVGNAVVSLENLPGSVEGDRAFCGYFVQGSNPENKIPIVLGFVFEGEYYPATQSIRDGRAGTKGESTWIPDTNSLDQIINWFSSSNGPILGDIFRNELYTFANINQYADLAKADEGYYPRKNNLLHLMQSMNNDFLRRVDGGGFANLYDALDPELGDIGAFAKWIEWTGKNNMSD